MLITWIVATCVLTLIVAGQIPADELKDRSFVTRLLCILVALNFFACLGTLAVIFLWGG